MPVEAKELTAAKVRQANAEAAKAELEFEVMARENEDLKAAPYEHHLYTYLGPVDNSSAHGCMSVTGRWARREPGCDMTIVFNSPGGSVIAGLALYDHLQSLRKAGHHITTVARGMAASMGGILLQAGDVRIVGENAHVLIHEVSSMAIGKFSEIEDEIAFTKRLQERLVGILAERSTLTAAQIKRRWKKTDWWLGADETVELGFADRIG